MRRRHTLLIVALLLILMFVVAVPSAFACDCSPGFWRNYAAKHDLYDTGGDFAYGSWSGTLYEAVWLKGGGENKAIRFAATDYLNGLGWDVSPCGY